MDTITSLDEGAVFTTKHGPDDDEVAYTVGAPCEDKNSGRWFCVTHNEGFANQLQKDFHVNRGHHALVWICNTHGPEQP